MEVSVKIFSAFAQQKNQGNPAGIVFDADHLAPKEMIYITQQMGFSECVFVQKSSAADFRLRFFSANQEVDLCGHATIACFSAITQAAGRKSLDEKILTQETRAGILPIYCCADGLVRMQQASPRVIDFPINVQDIADLLVIPVSSIVGDLEIVSTGSPKLIIPVDSLQTLFSIKPDLRGIAEYCKISGARGFYPFTTDVLEKSSDFHARQFNPLAGIDEDPVTGVAAGALGGYIQRRNLLNKTSFVVEQGYVLGKFGKMFVDIADTIFVGGYAIEIGEQRITLPR